MIRGIVFDCFGVLYGGVIDILAAMAPEGQARVIRDLSIAKDYGYISYDEHIEKIAEILGKPTYEIVTFIRDRQLPNTELLSYVRQLKDRYKVGLLSNTGDHIVQSLFDADTLHIFDAVVLSYNEGMIKPDPRIFELAAERLGLLPEECIMIDDLETNCEGARIAGMQAVRHVSNKTTERTVNELIGSV